MTLGTLARYLIGDRTAILTLVRQRGALLVGALLVLSAGFAREYDGEDLWHEPWHLLLPFGASLATSFVMFTLVWAASLQRMSPRMPFWRGYRGFLALYWLTAPLAWLYAIPYERFMDARGAIIANLWTLAAVSLWRVLLMIRVVCVLTGGTVYAAACFVLFCSAVAVAIASFNAPVPLMVVMGGLRLTDAERVLHATFANALVTSCAAIPILGIGYLVLLGRKEPKWSFPDSPAIVQRRVSWGVWMLVALSLLIWIPVLARTQPEQERRFWVEYAFRNGQIAEGLEYMSGRSPADFPPHWDPPPRPARINRGVELIDVVRILLDRPAAEWVRALYAEKVRQSMTDLYRIHWLDDAGQTTLLDALDAWPEGPEIASQLKQRFGSYLKDMHAERFETTWGPLRSASDP